MRVPRRGRTALVLVAAFCALAAVLAAAWLVRAPTADVESAKERAPAPVPDAQVALAPLVDPGTEARAAAVDAVDAVTSVASRAADAWTVKYADMEVPELANAYRELGQQCHELCTQALAEMLARGEGQVREGVRGQPMDHRELFAPGEFDPPGLASTVRGGTASNGNPTMERVALIQSEHPRTRDLYAERSWLAGEVDRRGGRHLLD